MSSTKIADYKDFDYKSSYWVDVDRKYENETEHRTLCRLLDRLPQPLNRVLDLGGGFGRLSPAYLPRCHQAILFDYAQHLLDEAKRQYGEAMSYVQGNVYELPFDEGYIDCVVCVRVLHHIVDQEKFFNEVARVIKPGGNFIIEVPNKRHLLQIFRYCFGKTKNNPFDRSVLTHSPTFLNYHPQYIERMLTAAGFTLEKNLNASFFRSTLLKKLIPYQVLVSLDSLCQPLLSMLNLSPSLFWLLKKK